MKMDSLELRLSVPTYVPQLWTKKIVFSKAVRQNLGFELEARRWSPALQEEALIQWLLQLKNV